MPGTRVPLHLLPCLILSPQEPLEVGMGMVAHFTDEKNETQRLGVCLAHTAGGR